MQVQGGTPRPLGATPLDGGTNVAVWAPRATGVRLCLFDDGGREHATVDLPGRTDGVWHGFVPGLGPGATYGFRVDGAHDPSDGARFDASTVLLDPYARAVTGGLEDDRSTMRAVVVDPAFEWGDDAPPRTPWERTVIYEAHVRGLTMLHPDVPEEVRGTYAALAHPAVLDHLESLGVTALELLPVHHFATEPVVARRGLVNYWGYNTAAWFAPHAGYSSAGDRGGQVADLQRAVRALHERGIEVLLDVVFNHSCEGGPDGPLVHLRGLDDGAYYRQHDGAYVDVTGCGNTLTTGFDAAVDLVLDSLRYWVTEMHVDGFRLDLASTLARTTEHRVQVAGSVLERIAADPVLSQVKLVAEPWDATAEGYLLGRFPHGWSEWNDRFRDDVRDFWRGASHGVGALASRLTGSCDVFGPSGRDPSASVNFVTAHDGFTLRDLVTYDRKHNEANGEDGRDGHGDNRSWGCGTEGPSDHPEVRSLRSRQAANLLGTLLLSGGVPMLSHGDEIGRTQGGNNNAYCHDDATTWVDWAPGPDWAHLAPLVRTVADLRLAHPRMARGGDASAVGWWHPSGRAMGEDDWHDGGLRSLGLEVAGDDTGDHADGGSDGASDGLLLLLHAGADPLTWRLPPAWTGRPLEVAVDTGEPRAGAVAAGHGEVVVAGRTLVVLRPARAGEPAAD